MQGDRNKAGEWGKGWGTGDTEGEVKRKKRGISDYKRKYGGGE